MKTITDIHEWALSMLKKLISYPSLSRNEAVTATVLQNTFEEIGIPARRVKNNVWAKNKKIDYSKPTLLLNSHHDTVPPNSSYTRDPYLPEVSEGKLFGLGANDAGGALVSLMAVFIWFYDEVLPFNVIFGASAEEEVSGKDGIELLLAEMPEIDFGIVGEPTGMRMAVAQKGLMVLDGVAKGRAGHAARDEGENALYKALKDISILKDFKFERSSDLLGPVHLAVTSIETPNKSHNVVPDECLFTVDVRANECYSFEEILEVLNSRIQSQLSPRSKRLKPSFIPENHPLVRAGVSAGLETYGSPTLSDMALMDFPAIKLGPGESSRSHTADEFIFVDEIRNGIDKYCEVLERLKSIILPDL